MRQGPEKAKRAGAAGPAEHALIRVLGELFTEEYLALFVNCITARPRTDGTGVSDKNVRVVSVKSEFKCRGFCFSLDEYHGALTVPRALKIEECLPFEQRDYDGQEFWGLLKNVEQPCASPRRAGRRRKVQVGSVLLLLWWLTKRDSESEALVLVRYTDCVPSMDSADEAV